MLHRYDFTYHAQPSRGQVLQAAPLLPIPALSRVRTTERDQSKDISTCHALGKKKKRKKGAFRAVASPRLPHAPAGAVPQEPSRGQAAHSKAGSYGQKSPVQALRRGGRASSAATKTRCFGISCAFIVQM